MMRFPHSFCCFYYHHHHHPHPFIDRQAQGIGTAQIRRIRLHGASQAFPCALRVWRLHTRLLLIVEGCEEFGKGGLGYRTGTLRGPHHPARSRSNFARCWRRHPVLFDAAMAQVVEFACVDRSSLPNLLLAGSRIRNFARIVQLQ